MKRRAAVEPGIGHLKREHRMDRCRLKGTVGDCLNEIFSPAGMNFRKLLRPAADFFFNSTSGFHFFKEHLIITIFRLASFSGPTI